MREHFRPSVGPTWRVIAAWQCCSSKVIDANYPRESGERAKFSSRATRHAGTALDSRHRHAFPRACASIIYSALSRKSLTSTASAVSVPTTIFTSWPMPRSRTCDASKAPADWKSSLVTLRMCKEQNGSKHRHDSGVSHTGDEYDRYARISDIAAWHTLEDVALERTCGLR